jgi:hypothetical protein
MTAIYLNCAFHHAFLKAQESDRNLEPPLIAFVGAKHSSLPMALPRPAVAHHTPGLAVGNHIASPVIRPSAVLERKTF